MVLKDAEGELMWDPVTTAVNVGPESFGHVWNTLYKQILDFKLQTTKSICSKNFEYNVATDHKCPIALITY